MPSLPIEKFTPVMQQYFNERSKITGKAVLLFRMGDFYEAFFDDATTIAKELDITLTGRAENNYPGGRIPMAGVPARAVRPYIAKLLENNYKVYIAEQMADPKDCKGLVPRAIAKVFTPGTINDLDLIDGYKNNFILALYSKAPFSNYGLAYADISTGEFYATEVQEEYLQQELTRINPAEIIIPSETQARQEGQFVAEEEICFKLETIYQELNLSPFNKRNFDKKLASHNLEDIFGSNMSHNFEASFAKNDFALRAAGAIIEYLKETQGQSFSSQAAKSFDQIKSYQVGEFMMLDASSRSNLEISKCLNGKTKDSLFAMIDRTASKPGKRRLLSWLEQPLFNLEMIQARQAAVTELIGQNQLAQEIRDLLSNSYDIDRLSNRLISQLINPKEAIALKDSLLLVAQISSLMQNLESGLLTSLKHIPQEVLDFTRLVEDAIHPEPGMAITDGNIIKAGFNQELDELIGLVEDSESWLRNFEETQRTETGIKNIKVAFNKVHGYFIETSRANQSKLPDHYIIRQTMINTVRAVTEELKEFEDKITNAQARRNALEHQIFTSLRKTMSEPARIIKELANQVAELDALTSMAILAKEQNYCLPELNNSDELYIKDGRHPVVEQKLGLGEFVANDISLNNAEKIIILTGPNMAGKSTYMRQNALIIILAQIGSYVPAQAARIGLVDRIFTRIGASDDLASGRSTFMVEMVETASILNGMSSKSFVVLDEIGRGTSTYDGVAIAWSIVEYLAKNSKPRTIFATHYHELANLDKVFPIVQNYQVLVAENNNPNAKARIEFLHKVVEGSADKSYGIEVARLAGLPKQVLERAKAINNQLQAQRNRKLGMSKKQIDQHGIGEAIALDGSLEIEKLPLFTSSQ
ncbi:MAG: DNA mismatch repair protein MutS [Cyanobacteria bacterium]|nr:DNA mismatch repair protein MutS [Cyanobacteriota bacterium]MDA1021047.1 DNA mismatch repair protein MutS [Cyanobacteriota bacterium]